MRMPMYETGAGRAEATVMINLQREEDHRSDFVSWSAVQRFAAKTTMIDTKKRGTTKSGKGPDSEWAKCRLAQCTQWD